MTITYFEGHAKPEEEKTSDDGKKKRRSTAELDLAVKDIVAAWSALGRGDYANLYVDGHADSLETNLSFKALKEKIMSEKGTRFVEAGTKYLINFDCIKHISKSPNKNGDGDKGKSTIFFKNGMQLSDINNSDIDNLYQNTQDLVRREEERTKQLSKAVLAFTKESQNKQLSNLTNAFKPLEDSINANGFLLVITDILLIIVAILSTILIVKL